MKISGIYKIESQIKPNRCYIGSSVNIKKRWNHHYNDLRNNKHYSQKLQRHYNKYGEHDLLFSIIENCDKDKLIEKEQYYIDLHEPYFNNSPTAGNVTGFKRSKETINKQRKSMIGKKWTKEQRERFSNKVKGIPKSKEHKKKLSEALKGRKLQKRSQEHCNNISKAVTGSNNPMYGKTPWNKGMAGNYPEEIRKKISAGKKGKPAWNKGKIKINGIWVDRNKTKIK